MASASESNLCSLCTKVVARYFCNGCNQHMCSKHARLHDQNLLLAFDSEIVASHNQLLEQIAKLHDQSTVLLEPLAKIDQWKSRTIRKVEQAAEDARNAFIEMTNKQRTDIEQHVESITKEIRRRRNEEDFVENDIDRLKLQINQLQTLVDKHLRKDCQRGMIVENDEIDWNRLIYIRDSKAAHQIFPLRASSNRRISGSTQWQQIGKTVAGGYGQGNGLHQLSWPYGFYVDDDQTIYIADWANHRIMEWKANMAVGRVVAGGNGQGNENHQLSNPRDVIVDKETDCLIICDSGNRRVIRWPLKNGMSGETILSNIDCWSLTMDENGYLYVVDNGAQEVRRYERGQSEGIVVAGGNGRGNRLDQFYWPQCIFVDQQHSLYVSDLKNDTVMKWTVGAKEGAVVACSQYPRNGSTPLSYPYGIVVDQFGTVYVADSGNERIMRWMKGDTQGSVIVAGHGRGTQLNQLNSPMSLSFDREGNLYVSDCGNHRIQRFDLIP